MVKLLLYESMIMTTANTQCCDHNSQGAAVAAAANEPTAAEVAANKLS
jgi:hypothetical protein